jgi:hypothetical protein
VSAVASWARRVWAAALGVAASRRAPWAVLALALAVYALYSVAWPLGAGRDLGTYLRVYVQLFHHAVYPQAMTARTPVGPLVAGGLLDAGAVVAEVAMALLYALSVLAWFAVARRFGPAVAVTTAVALLAFPGYVMLFHRLSTDALFAAAFALCAWLVARVGEGPTAARAAAVGGTVALLVLIRPGNAVLLLLGLVPLLAPGAWTHRVGRAAAFSLAALLPLLAWSVHNAVRFDDFAVARGGGSVVPLFRAFVTDRIVSPDNGPASRELAQAVRERLLPLEPYRSYGITVDRFFSSGSARMHEDLIGLSDRTWGWDDDYRHLARAGREAVRSHPGPYVRGVAHDIALLLRAPLLLEVPQSAARTSGTAGEGETIVVDGKTLPKPTEGEPIPAAHQSGYVSTPDGRIHEVWTSPTAHHVAFRYRADAVRAHAYDSRVEELLGRFSDRRASARLARTLNLASRAYPRAFLWLLVGVVAVAWRRPRRWGLLVAIGGVALLVVVFSMLGVYPVAEYAVPVTPAFVLLATAGLLGAREPSSPRPSLPSAR